MLETSFHGSNGILAAAKRVDGQGTIARTDDVEIFMRFVRVGRNSSVIHGTRN